MRVWKISIRPDPECADAGQGFARAETREEALALADHPDAYAFEMHPDKFWPGQPWERIIWSNPPPRRAQSQQIFCM